MTIYSLGVLLSQFWTSLLFHIPSVASWPVYRFLRRQVRWFDVPISWIFQFVVIHTVKGFSVVSEADVFLAFSCFFYDPMDVDNLISASSAFLNPSWTSGSFQFMYCWSLAWRILSITSSLRNYWNVIDFWRYFPLLHSLVLWNFFLFICFGFFQVQGFLQMSGDP